MSSLAPSSRRSKASKREKRDRDLEMMAVMAPTIQKRAAENRDIEELEFQQLVARIVGGMNMGLALLLVVVSCVILSIDCCGSHTEYNGETYWKTVEECETDADKLATDGSSSQWACYHRNLAIVVCVSFAIFLFTVGAVVITAGECFYGTARAQGRQEAGIEDTTAELRAEQLAERIESRNYIREQREERAAAREERREERRLEAEAAARPQPRYAGAQPWRAATVGAPAAVQHPITYRTYQTGAPVQYRVQPQTQFVQPQTQFAPRAVASTVAGAAPARIQVRAVSPQPAAAAAPAAAQSPLRIRISQPVSPVSPGRATLM